ncbi:hypothetical protein FGO68_gene16071 [Halteria grandinella]|uniref:Uncharacterized protein n=1 Tax=Halteria grandinella TaxID=5974 RepID=A0A8J8SV12_HALGN|nr:hypothetical protein FGO68_gene16071 [Halteria grandinella]
MNDSSESENETMDERFRRLTVIPENETVDERYDRYRRGSDLVNSDQRPLNRALTEVNKKHGVTFAGGNIGVWGLVRHAPGFTYPHLIQTLIEHFRMPYMTQNKETIARALMCKEARNTEAPIVIMQELKRRHSPKGSPDLFLRSAIVYSLSYIGDTRLVEDTIELIADDRYADVRNDLEDMLRKIQKRKWKPDRSNP